MISDAPRPHDVDIHRGTPVRPPDEPGDAPLIAAGGDVDPGDPDAGAVYRAFAPAVLGYLRSQHVPDPEGTLGEVFYRVTRDLPLFHGDLGDLQRWVFTIAHRRVADELRRRSDRVEEPRAEMPEPSSALSATADHDPRLLAALAELTEAQREVLGLRFVSELPLSDVAEITGRPIGAVKALQTRALARLRTLLDD